MAEILNIVQSLTDDSQIGANLQVCTDEENQTECDRRSRSQMIGAAGSGPERDTESGFESTDRAARVQWIDE